MTKFFMNNKFLLGGVLLATTLTNASLCCQEVSYVKDLFLALETNDSVQVQKILKANPQAVGSRDQAGKTPLHYAAMNDHEGIAVLLLSKGAEVHARDHKKITPLGYAVRNGHRGIIDLLIRNAGEVNAQTYVKDLFLALETNDYLLVLEVLKAYPQNVHSRDQAGKMPLHYAAMNNHYDIAVLLLRKGAEVDARDHKKMTPLAYAAKNGHRLIVDLLIRNEADIEAVDEPDIESVDNEGKTALALALEYGHTDVAKELVRRYAFVGGLEDALKNLPENLLQERKDALIQILDDPTLGLPEDVRNLIIQFVIEQ